MAGRESSVAALCNYDSSLSCRLYSTWKSKKWNMGTWPDQGGFVEPPEAKYK